MMHNVGKKRMKLGAWRIHSSRRVWIALLAAMVLLAALLCFLLLRVLTPKAPPPVVQEPETAAPVQKAARLLEIQAVPPGAQMLLYPLETGTIVSGFHNPVYREAKGYEHFAIDITPVYAVRADVLASGEGVVLGTEFCDNSVGNIAVIRYDNVYVPSTRKTIPLIARYYHMVSVAVKEGDKVLAGDRIGVIDGGHQNYNHTHIELDTDVEAPFYTPQVAEASSELLHRHPATGETILDPVSVLALGVEQRIWLHPKATFCTVEDLPKFRWNGAAQSGGS